MVFTKRSHLLVSKSTATVRPAPPSRLSSPLPLHFRRSRHDSHDSPDSLDGPDRFSVFEEDFPQSQTAVKPSNSVWGGHRPPNRQDGPKLHDGIQAQSGRKAKPLTIAQVKADLAETEWKVSNNSSAIERTYVFRDFERAFKYVNLIAARSKKAFRHFPIFSNWGNRLFIRWTSYNSNCITRADIQMARVCDRLFNDSFATSSAEPKNPFDQIPDDLEWTEDRQVMYGKDYFYGTEDAFDLWKWLPQVELYVQRKQEYPLWGTSYNRLVWTSLLWDGKKGAMKGLTKEERQEWRPGAPLQRIREQLYWMSNVADHASQYWNPEAWFEKPENPTRIPLRYSMARSNQELETKRKQQNEKPRNEKHRPSKAQGRTNKFRIFID